MSIKDQAQQFHQYLQGVKKKTPLDPGLQWYPWPTLAGFDTLDEMLRGDLNALLKMIGRRPVLDVGCGDGDTAFFLESLGARVDAVDNAPTNYNAMYGVRALAKSLNSPLRTAAVDIDLRPEFPEQHYGLTILLGVLYHLKNPYLVLETLAQQSNYIFMSTRVAQLGPDRKTNYGGYPVAYLVEEDELNADHTNYWIFTEECLKRILRRSGWDVQHFVVKGGSPSDPVSPKGDARAYVLAKSRIVRRPVNYRLLDGWGHLEDERWRWTMRHFSVEITPEEPLDSAELQLRFHIHDSMKASESPVTLRAKIDGQELKPSTYSTSGPQTYTVSTGKVIATPAFVEFELDRGIRPSDADPRELGVQVEFDGPAPISLG